MLWWCFTVQYDIKSQSIISSELISLDWLRLAVNAPYAELHTPDQGVRLLAYVKLV